MTTCSSLFNIYVGDQSQLRAQEVTLFYMKMNQILIQQLRTRQVR